MTLLVLFVAQSASAQINIEPFHAKGADALESPLPTDSTVGGNTGAISLGFPIEVPPGPGGFQPDLSLAYSSNGGDGFFGIGWGVSIGEIRCSTRFGVPDYGTCDRYELNGELLTYDGGAASAAPGNYHTFIESFQRIQYDDTNETWAATAIDGTTWRYGLNTATRIHLDGDAQEPVARWLLAEIENAFGQKICFNYDKSDPGTAYPASVTYAHETGCSLPKRKVEFVYEVRPDVKRTYAGGIETVVSKRATEIRSLSLTGSGWQPHRRRLLTYAASGMYSTSFSRLASTQLYGSDCTLATSLPSTACTSFPAETFAYSDHDTATANWVEHDATTATGWMSPTVFMTQEDIPLTFPPPQTPWMRTGDVNGDGLVDIVVTHSITPESPAGVHLNTGNGWQLDVPWSNALLGATYPTLGVVTQLVENDFGTPSQPDIRLGACSSHTVMSDDPTAPLSLGPVQAAFNRTNFDTVDSPGAAVSFYHELGTTPLPDAYMYVSPNFYLIDLNGDGLDDLVASVEASGMHLSLTCGGAEIPTDQAPLTASETLRVGFRNTGAGWLLDPSLVTNLPPLGVVTQEGEDYLMRHWGVIAGPGLFVTCDVLGMRGGQYGENADLCATHISLAPVFQDLDGDGRADVIVSARTNTGRPLVGFPEFDLIGTTGQALFSMTQSEAWINKPGGWVRAPEFDPPMPHAIQSHNILDQPPEISSTLPYSLTYDNAVHAADLNADGLPDLTWTAAAKGSTQFGVVSGVALASGVLMNTGRGDGTQYSAWCASESFSVDANLNGIPDGPQIAECAHSKRYLPPEHFTTPNEAGQPESTFVRLADLNGDGHADYYEAKHDIWDTETWARLSDPASPVDPNVTVASSAWLPEDSHFEPPIQLGNPPSPGEAPERRWGVSGVLSFDANGDGIADFVRASKDDYTGSGTPYLDYRAFISAGSLPNLLIEHDNGRGGVTKFTYKAGSAQRDAALGTLALVHANDPLVGESITYPNPNSDPLEPNGFNVRWRRRPVVASVTRLAPNLPSAGVTSTFEWSHPRWCADHRSEFGYRLVRATLPDGAKIDRYYFQKHGRAGKVSVATLVDASGQELFRHNEAWEVVSSPIPGTIQDLEIYLEDVVVGRITREDSTNQYANGPGATRTRELTYNDTHGYNFISLATFGRETGDLHRHFKPRALTPNEETRWLRNLVLAETDTESAAVDSNGDPVPPLIAQSTYEYSAEGALTLRSDLHQMRDGTGTQPVLVTERGYDGYGNVVWVEDPADRRTEFCYDGDADSASWCTEDFGQSTHSVGVGMQDAMEHVSTFEPDPVSGAIVEALTAFTDDPDLKLVRDAFDRVVEERVLAPGAGASGFLRKQTVYDDDATPTPSMDEIAYSDRAATAATSVWTRTITDGFSGTWKTVSESPTGYFGTIAYRNPAANTTQESTPTVCADDDCSDFIGNESSLETVVTVSDSMGRPLSITRPGAEIALFDYRAATRDQPVLGAQASPFDAVLAKSAKGDLNLRLLDGDRVVFADECDNTIAAGATPIAGVACTGADSTFYTYERSGEIHTVYDAVATATTNFANESHYLSYHFDTLGRVRQIDDPNLLQDGVSDSGYTRLEYDLAGNVKKRWNGRGDMTEQVYDDLNRLRWIYPPAGEKIVETTYRAGERQPGTVTTDLAQNSAGGTYTLTFSYDDMGRISRKKYDGSFWNTRSLLLDFTYDEFGRPVDVQYPDAGTVAHYEYNGAYLSQVCDVPGLGDDCTHTNAVDFISSVAYDTLGRRTGITTPSGTRTYGYDVVTQRMTQDAFTSPNYARTLDYGYDPLGNVTSIATPTADPTLDFAASYTYDSRNRIDTWIHGGSGGTTYTFDYDSLGNLTHHNVAGSGSANQEFAHAAKPNVVTAKFHTDPNLAKAYTYDGDGNLISETEGSGTARHFTFDSSSRLTCVGSSSAGCQQRVVSYDAAGMRIRDRDPATNIDRFFADDYFVLEVDVSTNANMSAELRIFDGGDQIARKLVNLPTLRAEPLLVLPWLRFEFRPTVEGVLISIATTLLLLLVSYGLASGSLQDAPASVALSLALAAALVFPPGIAFGGGGGNTVQRHWFLNDPVGSASVWLSEDGHGIMRVVYTPFGQVHEKISGGGNQTFGGHPIDDVTGLHYMKARWHNSETGTFVSGDPVVPNQHDPQSYNAYAYARNNPVMFNDPTGTTTLAGGGHVDGPGPAIYGTTRQPGDSAPPPPPPKKANRDANGNKLRTPGRWRQSTAIQNADMPSKGLLNAGSLLDIDAPGTSDDAIDQPFFDPTDAAGGFIAGLWLGGAIGGAAVGFIAGIARGTIRGIARALFRGGATKGGQVAGRAATTAFGKSVQSLKGTLGAGKGPWQRASAHAEDAVGRAYRGGTSIEEVFRNADTGEQLVRHTITRGGEILHETFRRYSKFGD